MTIYKAFANGRIEVGATDTPRNIKQLTEYGLLGGNALNIPISLHTTCEIDDEKNYDGNDILITSVMKSLYKFGLLPDVKFITNLPRESGLSGSTTRVVSLLKNLYKAGGVELDSYDIMMMAYGIERGKILKNEGGWQDQAVIAGFGGDKGFRYYIFKDGTDLLQHEVYPLNLPDHFMDKLNNMLAGYVIPRQISGLDIHAEMAKHDIPISMLKEKFDLIKQERDSLENQNIFEFEECLNQLWNIKKAMHPGRTNDFLDSFVNDIKKHGASSVYLEGAGSGGCILAFTEDKSKLNKYVKETFNLDPLDFKLEY